MTELMDVNNEESLINAIRQGQLSVVQQLHQPGCVWYPDACTAAAEYGHLEVLHTFERKDVHGILMLVSIEPCSTVTSTCWSI